MMRAPPAAGWEIAYPGRQPGQPGRSTQRDRRRRRVRQPTRGAGADADDRSWQALRTERPLASTLLIVGLRAEAAPRRVRWPMIPSVRRARKGAVTAETRRSAPRGREATRKGGSR